jgi:hypothetical protein
LEEIAAEEIEPRHVGTAADNGRGQGRKTERAQGRSEHSRS